MKKKKKNYFSKSDHSNIGHTLAIRIPDFSGIRIIETTIFMIRIHKLQLTFPPIPGENVTEKLNLGDLAFCAGVLFLFLNPFALFLNGFTIAIFLVRARNGVVFTFGVVGADWLRRHFLPLEPLPPARLERRFLPMAYKNESGSLRKTFSTTNTLRI